MTIDEIVIDLQTVAHPDDLDQIKQMQKDDLVMLFHGLGTFIRNEYHLWHTSPLTQEWRDNEAGRDIRDGIDYSLNHPDYVSMEIINALWKKLNE